MNQFSKLIEFVLSPAFIPVLLVGLAGVYLAIRFRWARWCLFGVTMYLASVAKFEGFSADAPWPPFVGPIESLVQLGRPLAILALGATFFVATLTRPPGVKGRVASLMRPIHAIQAVLLLKMLVDTNDHFFTMQSAVIFVLIGMVSASGIRCWLASERTLDGPALAACVTLSIFIVLVEYQLRVDPEPALLGGRVMGTTSNPQHAAVLLSLCMLGPTYFLSTRSLHQWKVFVPCVVLILGGLHLLFLTGSRTGLAMSVIITGVFLRRRFKIEQLIAGGFATAAMFLLLSELLASSEIAESIDELANRGDTRSVVWARQWEDFKRYPIFGNPFINGRLRPSENSWLGLMAATGVVGLSALVWLLAEQWKTARRLLRSRLSGRDASDVDFCLAILCGVFAGSFFEAYLLGIITLPVMYIAMIGVACDVVDQRTLALDHHLHQYEAIKAKEFAERLQSSRRRSIR